MNDERIPRWEDAAGNISLVTPTLCRLMGIDPPALSSKDVMRPAVDAAEATLDGAPVEKCLLFAPDAVGAFLRRSQRHLFDRVEILAPVRVPLLSVMPTKTFVCFASMFTGAMPRVHGVRAMEKQTLSCDTLFDALVRGGKRVALATTWGGCMDYFFRGRDMDYFIADRGDFVCRRAVSLLESGSYDVIVVYHSRYDGIIHRTHPESPEALEVAAGVIEDFGRLVRAFDAAWSRHDRVVLFTPDHGAHFDPQRGTGAHGLDLPEDMNLFHFFGFRRGSPPADPSRE